MLRREEIMEVMYLHRQGLKKRAIARKLGLSRETVSKYLACGGDQKPYDASGREGFLEPFRDRIRAWLEEDDYRATWMYDRLVPMGYEGGLRTVQRFVREERGGLVRKAFLAFETEPGRQAQVDFGEFAVLDADGNKIITLYLFLMVLGYSRRRYAEFLVRPDLPSFLEAHQRAFEFFGGIPAEILYDCMKNVVTRVNGQDPKWNEIFFSFAQHNGFAPRLCPPYASWVKGKVERPIGFIREGFWRGYRFENLFDANRDLWEWLMGKEKMVHGTTHQTITERFEAEQPFLGPLPPAVFDTSARYFRKVFKDCCVHFRYNRYMLPHRMVGREVMLRVKDGILRVFDGPELLITYRIPEGKGHLVADERFIRALREDQEQNRMKYRKPRRGRKGAARTIGLVNSGYSVPVQRRDIGEYAALTGGGHE